MESDRSADRILLHLKTKGPQPAARQINDFGAGKFGAVDTGSFEAAHTIDHERSDCDKGYNDEPGTDAQ